MSLALFSSTQSASLQCKYTSGLWGTLGTVYYCMVQNSISITSLDVATVDSISGTHLVGYNNDNVEGFSIIQGQVHYFPRGLNNFFKNLKGIEIANTGLKEIYQSNLKDFPKLTNLWLYSNDLEILEENLFQFNPNFEKMVLNSNKISQIAPTVFDKLTKLSSLYLESNICINMKAENSLTEVQNVIKTAKAQCTNSEYLNLEQKVKNLEIESKNLSLENFKEKLEKLENEIKNSKYSNSFYQRIENLKADLLAKEKSEFFDKISALIKTNINEMSATLESKINNVNEKLVVQGRVMSGISDIVITNNKNFENLKIKFLTLIKDLDRIFS